MISPDSKKWVLVIGLVVLLFHGMNHSAVDTVSDARKALEGVIRQSRASIDGPGSKYILLDVGMRLVGKGKPY